MGTKMIVDPSPTSSAAVALRGVLTLRNQDGAFDRYYQRRRSYRLSDRHERHGSVRLASPQRKYCRIRRGPTGPLAPPACARAQGDETNSVAFSIDRKTALGVCLPK
ncbi:hypothetical protein AB5N19_03033 [Seiridium cardinale]